MQATNFFKWDVAYVTKKFNNTDLSILTQPGNYHGNQSCFFMQLDLSRHDGHDIGP